MFNLIILQQLKIWYREILCWWYIKRFIKTLGEKTDKTPNIDEVIQSLLNYFDNWKKINLEKNLFKNKIKINGYPKLLITK